MPFKVTWNSYKRQNDTDANTCADSSFTSLTTDINNAESIIRHCSEKILQYCNNKRENYSQRKHDSNSKNTISNQRMQENKNYVPEICSCDQQKNENQQCEQTFQNNCQELNQYEQESSSCEEEIIISLNKCENSKNEQISPNCALYQNEKPSNMQGYKNDKCCYNKELSLRIINNDENQNYEKSPPPPYRNNSYEGQPYQQNNNFGNGNHDTYIQKRNGSNNNRCQPVHGNASLGRCRPVKSENSHRRQTVQRDTSYNRCQQIYTRFSHNRCESNDRKNNHDCCQPTSVNHERCPKTQRKISHDPCQSNQRHNSHNQHESICRNGIQNHCSPINGNVNSNDCQPAQKNFNHEICPPEQRNCGADHHQSDGRNDTYQQSKVVEPIYRNENQEPCQYVEKHNCQRMCQCDRNMRNKNDEIDGCKQNNTFYGNYNDENRYGQGHYSNENRQSSHCRSENEEKCNCKQISNAGQSSCKQRRSDNEAAQFSPCNQVPNIQNSNKTRSCERPSVHFVNQTRLLPKQKSLQNNKSRHDRMDDGQKFYIHEQNKISCTNIKQQQRCECDKNRTGCTKDLHERKSVGFMRSQLSAYDRRSNKSRSNHINPINKVESNKSHCDNHENKVRTNNQNRCDQQTTGSKHATIKMCECHSVNSRDRNQQRKCDCGSKHFRTNIDSKKQYQKKSVTQRNFTKERYCSNEKSYRGNSANGSLRCQCSENLCSKSSRCLCEQQTKNYRKQVYGVKSPCNSKSKVNNHNVQETNLSKNSTHQKSKCNQEIENTISSIEITLHDTKLHSFEELHNCDTAIKSKVYDSTLAQVNRTANPTEFQQNNTNNNQRNEKCTCYKKDYLRNNKETRDDCNHETKYLNQNNNEKCKYCQPTGLQNYSKSKHFNNAGVEKQKPNYDRRTSIENRLCDRNKKHTSDHIQELNEYKEYKVEENNQFDERKNKCYEKKNLDITLELTPKEIIKNKDFKNKIETHECESDESDKNKKYLQNRYQSEINQTKGQNIVLKNDRRLSCPTYQKNNLYGQYKNEQNDYSTNKNKYKSINYNKYKFNNKTYRVGTNYFKHKLNDTSDEKESSSDETQTYSQEQDKYSESNTKSQTDNTNDRYTKNRRIVSKNRKCVKSNESIRDIIEDFETFERKYKKYQNECKKFAELRMARKKIVNSQIFSTMSSEKNTFFDSENQTVSISNKNLNSNLLICSCDDDNDDDDDSSVNITKVRNNNPFTSIQTIQALTSSKKYQKSHCHSNI